MQRVLTAAVALPVLIASIYFAPLGLLFVLLASAALMAGLYEFWVLSARVQMKARRELGTFFAVVFLVAFYFQVPSIAPELLAAALVAFVVATLAAAVLNADSFEKMLPATGA